MRFRKPDDKILVSACLLGEQVRYDGVRITSIHPVLQQWRRENRVISACPEVLGGLPIPRLPAVIKGADGGDGVLQQKASVINSLGQDITEAFVLGAQKALELVMRNNIKMAVMKARSPSCGSLQIYDDYPPSKNLILGWGVASALLLLHGCKVFNEEQLEEAQEYFNSLV